MRETGYYWIKRFPHKSWEPAYYSSRSLMWTIGYCTYVHDPHAEINEIRIKNPDELPA